MYFSKNLTGRSALAKRAGKLLVRKYASFAVLLAMLLFASCEEEPEQQEVENSSFIPVGEWADAYGSGYKITAFSLEYYTADTEWEEVTYPGENIKGIINEVVNFSQGAGVLLVQITASTTVGQIGKFIGVYYKDYTVSHVFLANAIDGSYALIVKNTLAEAKTTFTVDNVNTHVTYWGSGYNK